MVISITLLRKFGKIAPKIVVTTDKQRAKIIRPIVCGNFKILILINEKIEASVNSMVESSRIPILRFLKYNLSLQTN